MKKNMKKMRILLVVCVLLLSFCGCRWDVGDIQTPMQQNLSVSSCASVYLIPQNYLETKHNKDEWISQEYKVVYPKNTQRITITLEVEGKITVRDSQLDLYSPFETDIISVSFMKPETESTIINICVSAFDKENKRICGEKNSRLYVISKDDNVFYSVHGMDHAKDLAGYEVNFLEVACPVDSGAECKSANQSSSSIRSGQTNETITVSGYFYWEDENGNAHPAKNIKVEVYD